VTCLTPQPQGSRVSPRRPSKRRSLRWGHAPRRGAEAWRAGACGRRALPDLPPRPKAGGSKIRQSYAFPRRSSLCGPRARASRARGPRRASGLAAASQPLPRTAALSRLLAATAVGALAAARGYGRVVREEGGGVSSQYGRRDETCPVSTGGRGGGGGGACRNVRQSSVTKRTPRPASKPAAAPPSSPARCALRRAHWHEDAAPSKCTACVGGGAALQVLRYECPPREATRLCIACGRCSACPLSTGGGTRLVGLARGKGGGAL
jgi:hypothetical protein